MATYAIGDIQGCYQTFLKLLKKIQFDPQKDQLWLVGDMINRGKHSHRVMDFILQNSSHIQCVLGNHELHFLAVALGFRQPTPKDTFKDILISKQRKKMVAFLLEQPLFYYQEDLNFAMVHAGIPKDWTRQQAQFCSDELSAVLKSSKRATFLTKMYGSQPAKWSDKLSGIDRLRYITNAMTRMRYCEADGSLELSSKMPLKDKPDKLLPWYEFSKKQIDYQLAFGHWASLAGQCPVKNLYALDTGCVWGGQLTAICLEDQQKFSCHNID